MAVTSTNGYGLLLSDTPSLDITTDWTIGFWINADYTTTSGREHLLARSNESYRIAITYYGASKLGIECYAGNVECEYEGPVNYLNNAWCLICLQHDSSQANEARLFHNGVLIGQANCDAGAAASATAISLGDGADVWTGEYTDLWCVNRVVPATRMAEWAAAKMRLPRSEFQDMVWYLPLAGPTGAAPTTAHWGTRDLSGNGNHVTTVQNSPTYSDDPFAPQGWVDGPFGGAWTVAEAGGWQLEGTMAAALTAAGALSRARTLAGSLVSELTGAGSLTRQRQLAASLVAELTATGALTRARALSAEALVALVAEGDLSRARALAATVMADLTGAGALTRGRLLSGALAAELIGQGELTRRRQLVGEALAELLATGTLTVTGGEGWQLVGAVVAELVATGTLTLTVESVTARFRLLVIDQQARLRNIDQQVRLVDADQQVRLRRLD